MKEPTVSRVPRPGWGGLGCAGCTLCWLSPAAVGHIGILEAFG